MMNPARNGVSVDGGDGAADMADEDDGPSASGVLELRDAMDASDSPCAAASATGTADAVRTDCVPGVAVEDAPMSMTVPLDAPLGPPGDSVEIQAGVLPRVHPALIDNGFAVVYRLRIENRGAQAFRDLTLSVHTEPPFATADLVGVAHVGAGCIQDVHGLDLRLDRVFFRGLTERHRGTIAFALRSGEELIAREMCEVDLCPPSEWPGLDIYPEFLAAFVLPNDPAVQEVLAATRTVLSEWGDDPSLDGYQSKDPVRVRRLAAALYTALQNQELTYVSPPASFAEHGQRVRLPGEVLGYRMGTCLDLSLLFAACLEQAGLHPLVVVVQGHALAGLWLYDEPLTDPFLEEPRRLRNHLELGEAELVDVTAVSSRPSPSFDVARAMGRKQIDVPERFLCAIDVHRSRKGDVRPIATIAEGGRTPEEEITGVAVMPSAAPEVEDLEELDRLRRISLDRADTRRTEDRLDHWCRKLLDLTMRNRLLNHRSGKKTIPLLSPDPAGLEDALAGGQSFRIHERPRELESESGLRRPGLSLQDAVRAVHELLTEEQADRVLRADLARDDLERRLVSLYRDARTAAEEGGTSNLYLAFGALEYRETRTATKTRRAPILLIPVELRRSSIRGGITLAMGGDEPRVNATLLEYLRRDHSVDVQGLDPLPKDESGLDVPLIIQTIRAHIRGKDGWRVEDEVTLGFFSFAKILIWKDLIERREELIANPLVNHLVHDYQAAWDDGVEFPSQERLDDEYPATEVLCPHSADSSQLAAVLAAANGKSFVLKGPPGTGKSQTITNLIAHSLAEGKRVLFVSEKMAALEVVHDRLKEVGLEDACLELHSNKARKKEVLEQLRQALHASARTGGCNWERSAGELNSLRRELNDYVRALHRRHSSGETPFTVLSRLMGLGDCPRVELAWPDVMHTSEERLTRARAAIRGLAEAAGRVGLRAGHPFGPIGHEEYTPQWERDAEEALHALLSALDELAVARAALPELALPAKEPLEWPAYQALAELCAHLLGVPEGLPPRLAAQSQSDELGARVAPWFGVGRDIGKLRARFGSRYREIPTCLPLDSLHRLVQEAHTVWFLSAWSKRRRILKALRSVANRPKSLRMQRALKDLVDARALAEREEELAAVADEASVVFGDMWRGADSDWEALETAVGWTVELGAKLEPWCEALQMSREKGAVAMVSLLAAGDWGREGQLANLIARFQTAWETVVRRLDVVRGLLAIEARATELVSGGDAVAELTVRIRAWLDHWREIPAWCAWRRGRNAAINDDLGAFVKAVEDGEITVDQVERTFERAYADAWFTAVSSSEPVLARFLGSEHEARVVRFRRLDDDVLKLTREELRRRVHAQSARPGDAPASSEQGILQRELTKKTRHKAIRQLFREIPTLLPRLKPCLLMSPMSVAQYLEKSRELFDLLVFDEASQIPVWDAVGVIARARQLVVVGDPEQLPPTSFFDRADEEVSEDVVEDQESILGECLACRFPVLTLDWHYRSRHESLIAFSNDRYYDNRLITFPSCEEDGLGVSFRFVEEGVYDRGKSRTNEPEARALVGEVVRRLKDPLLGRWSVGVVTFNQAQQQLIENLLDDERRRHPEIEAHFKEESPCAVFVKNLENVQGDERDVILFSIGYGPDSAGRLYMSFGPLTSAGGQRRLNVAITRARRQVVIFSSIRADQIPLQRAHAQGVQDLRLYLEYAEHGPKALGRALSLDPNGDVESPFEAQVKAALEAKGYQVHAQVGCSGYRIDLAVVDPEKPGHFVLGVECDGAMYHSARTARDRDKLRQGVLEGLGWRLHRIWSTEWWRDPGTQIARVEQAIEDAQRHRPRGSLVAPSIGPIATEPGRHADMEELTEARLRTSAENLVEESPGRPYIVADLGRIRGTQETFYDPRSKRMIGNALRKLVEVEGPISFESAARRVGALWGFERVRARARRRMEQEMRNRGIRKEEDEGEIFLWPAGTDPADFDSFRPRGPAEASQRQARSVSTWEFANAALFVLGRFGGMNEADLIREVGRLFGYARIGTSVRIRIAGGLERLRSSGRIEEQGDAVYVRN